MEEENGRGDKGEGRMEDGGMGDPCTLHPNSWKLNLF
jgi:hypothetical protein